MSLQQVPLPSDVDYFPITAHHAVFCSSYTTAVTILYLLMNETVLFNGLLLHIILWKVCETSSLDYKITLALQ